jgi:hypothetical protein
MSDDGAVVQHIPLSGAPVAWRQSGGEDYLATIGNFGTETNQSAVFVSRRLSGGLLDVVGSIVDGYPRISDIALVQHAPGGRADLFVAAFGSWRQGRLSLAHLDANRLSEPPVDLISRPGAVGLAVADVNGDHRSDVLALFAEGRNELIAFLRRSDNSYEERQLLEESSSYGFNSILVADLDGDGSFEVVLINGNNTEFVPTPLRPYHGLRVYSLGADVTLRERYHYPLHGAVRAGLGDFDGDGDLDIVVISLFPDWRETSPVSAVLLTNAGKSRFVPSRILSASGKRWLSIGVGDIDADGDADVVLGGALLVGRNQVDRSGSSLDPADAPALLLLRNRRKAVGAPASIQDRHIVP